MNDSRQTLLRRLTATSWRDWVLYTLFVFTFAGLCLLADEINWQSDILYSTLTTADDGKLIGVTANTGQSKYYNRFLLFDDNLKLKKTIRLESRYSFGRHALSEDGKYLIYVVRERFTDLVFNLVALDGSRSPTRIVLPGPYIAKTIGRKWTPSIVHDLQLIGSPPRHFLVQTHASVFLVDLSGHIVSHVDNTSYGASSNRKYASVTTVINQYVHLFVHHIDSDELKLIHREPIRIDPRLIRFQTNSKGVLAVQDRSKIRLIDLQKNESTARDTTVPWSWADGELVALNEDRKTLVLEQNTSLYVYSIQDQKKLAELALPFRCYASSINRSDGHRVVFSRLSVDGQEPAVVVWDWKNSTTQEVSPRNHTGATKVVMHCAMIVVVLTWTACFFATAVRHGSLWFGIATLICALSVFIRWTHLAPGAEDLTLYLADLRLITPPMLCQIGISVASLWAFKYLRFSLAAAITICLAAYTAHWYHFLEPGSFMPKYFIDARYFFQNMVLSFAVGMILAQMLVVWRASKQLSITISDMLILTVAAAIATKQLMNVLLVRQDMNMIIFGLLGGTTHLVQTFYADRLSRNPLRYSHLLWLPLIAIAFFALILLLGFVLYLFGIGMVGTINFWASLLLTDLVIFAITWLALRLVCCYLEPKAHSSEPRTIPSVT